ncbi:MAG TPA: BTAD domain-containing putative transcriptional regulator [Acidimicrobiia bacterium]|nr:BTAD domain-containing putative transcriptional regulator [Acidimicrobiia bacterium]
MTGRGAAVTGVRVLGGVHAVAADGSLIAVPSATQRRLLAILALHAPRALRSEWLADLLDLSPGALRTGVSRLRATLGGELLETGSTGYALSGSVDAARFCAAVGNAARVVEDASDDHVRALEAALAGWNGSPLEEFTGEGWADGEIARLTEIHGGTVDDLAEALVVMRRPSDAVALLRTQIAQYPFRDRSRGLLIRALASDGRQADALRAFQDYRTLLVEDAGTEPSPEVVRIERRVATGWDGVERAMVDRETPSRGQAPIDLPPPAELAHDVRFVGRATELELFAGELASVANTSRLRSVVLDGEPGIGKTALLGSFARRVAASESASVLYARCDETGVALQPFRSVLTTLVRHAPAPLLAAHVAQHGGELLRLCPSLSHRVPTAPVPTETDDATQRFLVFEAVTDVFVRSSRDRPLVLMLDDVQWADATTLRLLRHLAHALVDAAVLLVVSSRDRPDDDTDAVRLTLAELDRGETRRVALAGLEPSALRDLVEDAAPNRAHDDEILTALVAQTGGHPLYASQLVRHWADTAFDVDARLAVPPSLRDVVWARVRALGDDAVDVLTSAAVLGFEFSEDVLLDMEPRPETVVIDTLDAAVRAGLIVGGDPPLRRLRFAHALVANALYGDVGPSRRARIHGFAARALQKSADELPPAVVVQIARHCALAGWAAEAQVWSTRAGDHALDHLAPTEAAQHFRAALDLATALGRPDDQQADLMVRLGDALHRTGDTHAFEMLETGARLAQRSGAADPLVRAVFAADRGFMHLDERAPEYRSMVEAALAATPASDRATVARLRALLAQSLMYTRDAARRLALAGEAIDLARAVDDPALLARIGPPVVNASWAPGRRELRSRVAADAVRAAETTGDPALEFSAYHSAYNVAVEYADAPAAARLSAKLRVAARRVAEPRFRWTAGLIDTFETMMAGRLTDAETIAASTLDLGLSIGETDAFSFFAGEAFVIGTFAGRHQELLALVEQGARDNPDLLPFKLAHGIVCAAAGRTEVARDILLDGMGSGFAELPLDNVWTTSVLGYAVLAIELGEAGAATHLLPLIEPLADEVAYNGVTSQGPVAAYVGKLASLLDEHERAEDALFAALAISDAFGWTYHRATTLFALAQNRFRRDRTLDATATAWLDESSELCRTYGFASWARQATDLANVAGR